MPAFSKSGRNEDNCSLTWSVEANLKDTFLRILFHRAYALSAKVHHHSHLFLIEEADITRADR